MIIPLLHMFYVCGCNKQELYHTTFMKYDFNESISSDRWQLERFRALISSCLQISNDLFVIDKIQHNNLIINNSMQRVFSEYHTVDSSRFKYNITTMEYIENCIFVFSPKSIYFSVINCDKINCF